MNTPTSLPPHDMDSERGIIGCALLDAALAPELRLEWFYDQRHRELVSLILAMATEGNPIDESTVKQQAKAKGIKDHDALVDGCLAACHSAANFTYWRDILTEKLTLRKIIKAATEATLAAQQAHTGRERSPADVLDEFERAALSIRHHNNGDAGLDIKTALHELTAEYDLAKVEGRPRGLATGFHDLDKLLGGLKPQQLFIIAARPSVGKTSLALNIAERVALDHGLPVGFFSLEMSGKELLHRLACSRARVDGALLNEGGATPADIGRVANAQGLIVKAPLEICDAGGLSIAQLTARARRMVQRSGIKLLIVDYLGLLRSGEKGRSRYEETSLVSNSLKALAKELNLPVIALAQLNRDTERENRAPRLADLRDSGAIEQDADIVALLHRGEDQTGEPQSMSVIIAKQRTGRIGAVRLKFHQTFTRFEN